MCMSWNKTGMEHSVPKRQHIKFRSRVIPIRKHTTFRTWRKFEIKNSFFSISLSRFRISVHKRLAMLLSPVYAHQHSNKVPTDLQLFSGYIEVYSVGTILFLDIIWAIKCTRLVFENLLLQRTPFSHVRLAAET
jgi:hypothetical protein